MVAPSLLLILVLPQTEPAHRLAVEEGVQSLAWSPDGRTLAVGTAGGTIEFFDARSGERLHRILTTWEAVAHLAFSPDGLRILASGETGRTELRPVFGLSKTVRLSDASGRPSQVGFSPDGRFVAMGDINNELRVWRAETGELVHKFDFEFGGVSQFAFAPDSSRIAGAGAGLVFLWDLESGRTIATFQDDQEDGKVREERSMMPSGGDVGAVAFASGGSLLITAGEEKPVLRFRDVASGRLVKSVDVGMRRIESLSLSDGGALLVPVGYGRDESVEVWDTSVPAPVLRIRHKDIEPEKAALSPDGRRLAVGAAWHDGVLVFELIPASSGEDLKAIAEQMLDADPEKAFASVRRLVAEGDGAAAHLKSLWLPGDPRNVEATIAKLDDEDVGVREQAQRDLLATPGIEPTVREALKTATGPEQRARLEALLSAVQSPFAAVPLERRLVQALEWIGTDEARAVLGTMGTSAAESALARIRRRDAVTQATADARERAADPYAALEDDPELKARVEKIRSSLDRRLIGTFPGVEIRIARGDAHTWTELFLEAIAETGPRYDGGRPRFPDLPVDALKPPAVKALDGIEDERELEEACAWIQWRRVVEARPRLRAMLEDERPAFRLNAAKALTTFGDKEGIPAIVELIEADDRTSARVAGQLRLREAVPGLIDMLGNREFHATQMAAFALGRIAAPEAVPELTALLLASQYPDTVGAVAWALARIQERTGERVADDAVKAHIRETLRSQRMTGLSPLHSAAADLGVTGIVEILVEKATQGGHIDIFELRRVLRFPPEEIVPHVLPLLDHEHHLARLDAFEILAATGEPSVIPKIAGFLHAEKRGDRAAAIEALGKLRAREYVADIRAALKDEESSIRGAAVRALASMRETGAVEEIAERLADENMWVRVAAVEALADLDATAHRPAAEKLLEDTALSDRARRILAEALCRMGSRKAAPALLEAAHADRHASLEALNVVRAPETWKKLRSLRLEEDLLGTTEEQVREIARRAGLEVDDSEVRYWHYSLNTWSYGAGKLRKGSTLLESLTGGRETFILDGKTIRLLPAYEARRQWEAWWSGQEDGGY